MGITLFLLLPSLPAGASEYLQVPGLIDLRTSFSDGALDLESLVLLAKEKGFPVVIVNDHDRMVMEYGLFPFRNIIKKRVERNSINKIGAELYLESIRRVQQRHPDMIVIPGSETVPFYYWTGSYWDANLTAHDHEKRLLTIGMDRPEDYEHLPVLHNGFSTRYVGLFLPKTVMFLIPFLLGLFLIKWKGPPRVTGIVISALSLLFMINAHPFRSSPFDPYHGDHGIAPYQTVIDYVHEKGGLTFWNYPETRSGVRKLGPIFVNTPPYPEALIQARGCTGFAALYGDRITLTEPGNIWDRVLLEYCRGERTRPLWGIATADFHEEGGANEVLGNFPTVFLVKKRTKKQILFAMARGKMYACRGQYPQRLILREFSLGAPGTEVRAVSGDEIALAEAPRIRMALSSMCPTGETVTVRLIRSGKVIKQYKGPLPMDVEYTDDVHAPGRKIYYRMDVRGCGAMVSNPIFVVFQ